MTKARNSLGDLVKRVHDNKEYLILEKDGVPVVGIMDIDEFEDYLELNDPKAQRDIRKCTEEFRAGKSRPASEFLAELQAAERKRNKRRTNASEFLAELRAVERKRNKRRTKV